MAANVEIKARPADFDDVERRAKALTGGVGVRLVQRDTFFGLSGARLKLRIEQGRGAELIHYRRADEAGPKRSSYSVVPVSHAEELEALLGDALGVIGRVAKRRTLYMVGRTRIHLDRVEGLGDYVELEVVLEPGEATEDGEREARAIMERLGLHDEDLVCGAYLDLFGAGGRR